MSVTEKSKISDAPPPLPGTTQTNAITVVDLDKRYTRKQIKKLRKGQGKLMTHVSEVLQEMSAHNALPAFAHPIVVVVREKDDAGWDILD